jgi:hypothetical protein
VGSSIKIKSSKLVYEFTWAPFFRVDDTVNLLKASSCSINSIGSGKITDGLSYFHMTMAENVKVILVFSSSAIDNHFNSIAMTKKIIDIEIYATELLG